MSFGIDDYEKAIARILSPHGKVIGTGFLVAPGYVMTCAHVVLQAVGLSEDDFKAYEGEPQDLVSLDFHVLAVGVPIEAEVVAWLPYSLETGDVAVLKLRSPAPKGARSIPLVEVLRDEVEADRHVVYGFGENFGGRSDAYRPKANAAGGRFQLCKHGSDDETIKSGFSGAPVWNEAKKCVIGMVATAGVIKDGPQSTAIAFAIPTQKLRPVLNKIQALYLDDVLEQSLEGCNCEDERRQMTIAIKATLRHCNPNGGDRSQRQQLVDLAIDHPPVVGWETEGPLLHFVMMLAYECSGPIYEQLKAWVGQCAKGYKFSDLFERLTCKIKQRPMMSSKICEHLMVVVEIVENKEPSQNDLRVSLWSVPDRATYNPRKPLPSVVSNKTLQTSELPSFIRKQIREKFRKNPTPMIHLFVPRSLFNTDLEMMTAGKISTLGSEYRFVIRTNLNAHTIGNYYYDDWNDKWDQIESASAKSSADVFDHVNCSLTDDDVLRSLVSVNAAILQECVAVGELFDLISEETALPVALWSRNSDFQGQLTDMLDGDVETFCDRIRQERDTAYRSSPGKMLGHHLSLMWEDPKIIPPNNSIEPDDC